jgi:RimJ/RimL family protein N-acetyltransferase
LVDRTSRTVLSMVELRFPSPPLADEVVAVRPWRESDVPAQLRAFRDPVFRQFSDWEPQTEADALRHLEESERARQRGERVSFALVEPDDLDALLGGASVNDMHEPRDKRQSGTGWRRTLVGEASPPMQSGCWPSGPSRTWTSPGWN